MSFYYSEEYYPKGKTVLISISWNRCSYAGPVAHRTAVSHADPVAHRSAVSHADPVAHGSAGHPHAIIVETGAAFVSFEYAPILSLRP